jgi:hypothetical protein
MVVIFSQKQYMKRFALHFVSVEIVDLSVVRGIFVNWAPHDMAVFDS